MASINSMIAIFVALALIVSGTAFAGIGPAASLVDSDGDGTYNWSDNCPDVANAKQTDSDGDSLGDSCEGDIDDDGIIDDVDGCEATLPGAMVDEAGCAATQLDGDDDGLSDAVDACATTPADEIPDESGCSASQRDGDDDGVSEASDQCPDTVVGETVDENGCSDTQLDGDDDGVSDADDDCPSTPEGEVVDEVGCSPTQLDGDGDGVSDSMDDCLSTPAGEAVDGNGCSSTQLDGDGDGVSDADDDCSSTPAGEVVDETGCSPTEKDSDGDGFIDIEDACPNTPAGETVASDGCAEVEVDQSLRPWWCNSSGTGHGSGQHGMMVDPAYQNMTKGNLSWQDCLTLSAQFEAAINWAMQWPTLGDAEEAGFIMSVDYVEGMGTHHVMLGNFSMDEAFDPLDPEFPGTSMDGVFEFDRPEFLMYSGNTADSELVGFAWYVKTNSTSPPEGFAGDNDWWHRHSVLCFLNSNNRVVGEDITDEQCESVDGVNVHLGDYWMAHAWIIEPWLQHYDVFANHHPCLKENGPETDTEDSCWHEAMHGGMAHDG